jgi:elongator complex protein 6
MSTRLLDSGTASDVSGVLRITPGGGYDKDDDDMGETVLEKELLYHVLPDGNVTVFERGTGVV